MKTKKQLIKDAWGVIWFLFTKEEKEKLIINNGYFKGSNDDVYEAIDQNEHLFDFIAGKGSVPYSLEGIDNNNGWISINSEEHLPKESYNYWIMQSDGLIQTMKEYEDNKKFFKITATHYQPIVKPKLPLHK